MKKYIKPTAQGVTLFAEDSMLAGSPIKMYNDGTNAGSESLSNGQGWDSNNWSGADVVEED